jgi:hypothetical protein
MDESEEESMASASAEDQTAEVTEAPEAEPTEASEPAPTGPEVTPFDVALQQLFEMGQAVDQAHSRLSPDPLGAIRGGCGECATRTPIVYGLEAHFAAVQLLRLASPADRSLARRRTEEWLARPLPVKKGQPGLPAERCPYLMADGRCLVFDGRPLACRIAALPEAAQPEVGERMWALMENLMRFVAAGLPAIHHYVLLPAGVYAALGGREGRNIRKDIRRLKLDARRFTAWPVRQTVREVPDPAAAEASDGPAESEDVGDPDVEPGR